MSRTLLKSVEAPPTAFETDVCEQHTSSKTSEDFSFEIWREIFKVVTVNEKKALETRQNVQFTLEVTQRAPDYSAPLFVIELICEPGQPARAVGFRARDRNGR